MYYYYSESIARENHAEGKACFHITENGVAPPFNLWSREIMESRDDLCLVAAVITGQADPDSIMGDKVIAIQGFGDNGDFSHEAAQRKARSMVRRVPLRREQRAPIPYREGKRPAVTMVLN